MICASHLGPHIFSTISQKQVRGIPFESSQSLFLNGDR